MFKYGLGGQEVPKEASEGMADIPMNRTLMVEKLTNDAPVKAQVVEGIDALLDAKALVGVDDHFTRNLVPQVAVAQTNVSTSIAGRDAFSQHARSGSQPAADTVNDTKVNLLSHELSRGFIWVEEDGLIEFIHPPLALHAGEDRAETFFERVHFGCFNPAAVDQPGNGKSK